jgi:hypothetical protein
MSQTMSNRCTHDVEFAVKNRDTRTPQADEVDSLHHLMMLARCVTPKWHFEEG